MIHFCANYNVFNGVIEKRKEVVVVRTFPSYSSNGNSENYGLYCKYQLLKYKPWVDSPSTAWCNEDETDTTYINYWHSFLDTPGGRRR